MFRKFIDRLGWAWEDNPISDIVKEYEVERLAEETTLDAVFHRINRHCNGAFEEILASVGFEDFYYLVTKFSDPKTYKYFALSVIRMRATNPIAQGFNVKQLRYRYVVLALTSCSLLIGGGGWVLHGNIGLLPWVDSSIFGGICALSCFLVLLPVWGIWQRVTQTAVQADDITKFATLLVREMKRSEIRKVEQKGFELNKLAGRGALIKKVNAEMERLRDEAEAEKKMKQEGRKGKVGDV